MEMQLKQKKEEEIKTKDRLRAAEEAGFFKNVKNINNIPPSIMDGYRDY